MKILGVLVQRDNGKLAFVKADEQTVLASPDILDSSGIVDNPTPEEVKYQEAVKVKEANVDNILAKYKEK